jgi:putative ABC transport system permease protein
VNLLESFRIAWRALNANKVRSALTMLGVIIGVAAVILLVAIGSGVQQQITGQIEGLGSNLIFVFPGNFQRGGGGGGGGGESIRKPFTIEDARLLQSRLIGASAIVPALQAPGVTKRGNKTWRTSISAGNEQGNEVFTATIAGGRFYRRDEVQSGARVVLLGSTVRTQLFGSVDPISKKVSVNGQPFTVIGDLATQGGGFGGDQDNVIYMPYTTAQRLIGSSDISTIIVKAANASDVTFVQSQIKRLLKPKFGEDFSVFTQQQTLGLLSTLLGTLTAMLAGIAGISLLVGGIGIMNIMLVSVSERTREIGIRKAVGARTYDILSQFVIEAIVLSVLGGVVGILLGALGAYAMHSIVPAKVTWWSVTIAFFFAAGVGVFFGVYPAWRASKLDPITALRYE